MKTLHVFIEQASESSPSNAKIIVDHLTLGFDCANATNDWPGNNPRCKRKIDQRVLGLPFKIHTHLGRLSLISRVNAMASGGKSHLEMLQA